ncbi:tetratricopeptide repeat protein, partial [Pyxidicoccus fallax]
MAIWVLGCAAGVPVLARPQDVRLRAAQEAYDEAMRLQEVGRYAEATVRAHRALELREAVLWGSHLEVASCLNLLGGLHRIQGDFDRAEPLYARAISILESEFVDPYAKRKLNDWVGLLSPRALALEGAKGVYHEVAYHAERDDHAAFGNLDLQNLYDPAEPLYQRALDMAKGSIGKHHPIVAATLNELGLLYAAQGLYVRAEPLLQRALDIRETALGKHHPTLAASLNNLAILHANQGLYVRAEPLLQRALDIRLAALGQDHPDVAASLNNLAILYASQGLYDRAEALHARAISLAEAALGKSHPTVATSLSSLANLYVKQRLYARAEPLYQRALDIRQAAFGQDHPTVAASLTSLANVYQERGLYGSAEPLYQFALTIREAALGKHHPDVAASLNNLAVLYANQGLHDRAEPLYERALTLREAALGENHPEVAALLNNLALLRLSQHRLDAAIPLFTRAFAISEQRLRQEALDFSEARLASFLQLLRTDEERLYALLRARDDDRVRHLALGAALLLKGRSVAQTADISRAVYQSLGEEGRDTFAQLRELRTQLATLSLQGPGPLPLKEYQQQLKALAEQGDALEADLARRSAPLRELAGLPPLTDIVDQVAEALPEDAALIELISYQDRPLVPGPGAPEPHQRYLALVLLPDTRILSLDLGPAGPIDSAASRLRDALANRDVAFQARAQALYGLVFQPLLPLLGTTRHLFLSPDGPLALVPFAALHDGERFLVEDFDFVYLTSGRDLLRRPQPSAPASSVV